MMPRGLDTYTGRKVTRTEVDSDGNWFIELEGNVRVINTDGRRTLPSMPGDGQGFLFTTVVLEETQTQMVFQDGVGAEWRVAFNPMQYQIFDNNEAWSPQVGEPTPIIPDPSAERIADGPDTPPPATEEDEE